MNELVNINLETNQTFMSFTPESMSEKVMVYNAINNPNHKLSDFINREIIVKDVIVMGVEIAKDNANNPFVKSKENFDDADMKRKANRVIIIDMDGESYSATSDGIFTSIRAMLAVFGTLHFEEGLKVTVKQVTVKRGSLLTLSV